MLLHDTGGLPGACESEHLGTLCVKCAACVYGSAGDRRRTLVIKPHTSTAATMQVVAHVAGPLPLPQLRLISPAHDSSVDVLAERSVVVLPCPLAGAESAESYRGVEESAVRQRAVAV